MSKVPAWVRNVMVVAIVGALAWPVYAHCGKCAADCKKMVTAMDAGKVTLAKVIEAAETASKGKALTATTHMAGDAIEFTVDCLVGEKIMEVKVDKTGKAGEMKEAKSL